MDPYPVDTLAESKPSSRRTTETKFDEILWLWELNEWYKSLLAMERSMDKLLRLRYDIHNTIFEGNG